MTEPTGNPFSNDFDSTSDHSDFSSESGYLNDIGSPSKSGILQKIAVTSTKTKLIAASVVVALGFGGTAAYGVFTRSNLNLYVALGDLFKAKSLDATFSLNVAPSALKRVLTDDEVRQQSTLPGVTTVQDVADAVANVKIHIQSESKFNGTQSLPSDLEKSRLAISVAYGDCDALDVRMIDRVLYLSTGVKSLPNVSPQIVSQQSVDDMVSTVKSYTSFLAQDSLAVRVTDTLLAGTPVSLNLQSSTTFGKQFDDALKETLTTLPSPAASSNSSLTNLLTDSLRTASTINNQGTDDTGSIYVLSLDTRQFGQTVLEGLDGIDFSSVVSQAFSDQTEEAFKRSMSTLAAQQTAKTVKVKMWVASSELKRIDFDLSQVINVSNYSGNDRYRLKDWDVVLRIDLGKESATAPSNSVDFTKDFEALMNL